ncbi:MAG TPA: response regulator transcription factor [Longimicrobiales bacterium]|nr:response regulator transcription factor [Longimicrobiales bacterium]
MSIRVYIVEDHPLMRQTLQDYLGVFPEIELCGMAASADEAVGDLDRSDPSLVLVDLSLPGRSGIELMQEINARWGVPCVILSGHGERSQVDEAFAAGARGYVLKGRPEEVPDAIREVMRGQMFLSETLRRSLGYQA